jgi:hypothetical protein
MNDYIEEPTPVTRTLIPEEQRLALTACLYAFSHCSFSRDEGFGRLMADHYHLLRAHMFEHPKVASILGATD